METTTQFPGAGPRRTPGSLRGDCGAACQAKMPLPLGRPAPFPIPTAYLFLALQDQAKPYGRPQGITNIARIGLKFCLPPARLNETPRKRTISAMEACHRRSRGEQGAAGRSSRSAKRCGSISAEFVRHVAHGLSVRHDHGLQNVPDPFQSELSFLGIENSPAFSRAPEAQWLRRALHPHTEGKPATGRCAKTSVPPDEPMAAFGRPDRPSE